MYDIDSYIDLFWKERVSGSTSGVKLENNIRYNNKILVGAEDQAVKYLTKRHNLKSTFENVMRSVGLGVGVAVGGPIGAATLSTMFGGLGAGAGEYLGDRVYGKAIAKLQQTIKDYKYKQLNNQYALSYSRGTVGTIDEFYNQSYQALSRLPQELET